MDGRNGNHTGRATDCATEERISYNANLVCKFIYVRMQDR